MTFPHLPGIRNHQKRANLERAFEEITYYSRKLWAAGQVGITAERLTEVKDEMKTPHRKRQGKYSERHGNYATTLKKYFNH